MSTKAFFPCGGGSNLILGTGMENQIFILRTPVTVKYFLEDCQKIIFGIILDTDPPPEFMLLIINYTN